MFCRHAGVIGETTIEAIRYRDPALSFDERVDDLLDRLTAEEKIAMLHQRSSAVPHLGLAEFNTGMEGVHGASWRDHAGTGKVLPATVFPQPVGLAAAWDPELARAVGRATGRENRALRDVHPQIGLNVWAPVVNLLRDPRWGRNEEGYSEDPLLSALLGTAFSHGLSGGRADGYLLTAPTLKHFLAYNNEDFRDLTSSSLRPRVLHEYDLVPFRAALEADAATGVMPSYNLVNGRPAHVSPLLRLIREWTSQELLVCSDAWAPSNLVRTEHYFDDYPEAHAAALLAGMDSFTDKDGDGGEFTAGHVTEAVKRGLISMADVDRAVRRKLLIRLRLGEFDPDGGPFVSAGVMDTTEHRELALAAARRSAVLLQNEGGLLPLAPKTQGSEARGNVAVVGPLAASLYEDWYSPALPYAVSVADGLGEVFGSVVTHEGADRVRTDLGDFDVFSWGDDIVTLRSAASGKYVTVTRDGELAVTADKPDGWTVYETFRLTLVPGGAAFLQSTATQQTFRTRWQPLTDGVADAVAAARAADVAVVVVGNDPMIGGREAHDRQTLQLPPAAARLVREVTAANPQTVLVIMSSYPYVTPDAPAIVWTSHAGQETGRALAALLTGEHAFEGRLPQAWPAADADLPEALDYDIIKAGWTYQYAATPARFPFGHGLTYTTFSYGPLQVGAFAAGSGSGSSGASVTSVTALLDVTNTGHRAGTEVVQLYASYPGADQPRRRLIGFTRVALEPGETAAVTIAVPAHRLELWDVAAGRMALPGPVEILAGASSEDIRQTASLALPAGFSSQRPARVAGADFDDYVNVTLTDTGRSEGDAVTPADLSRAAWVRYDNLHPARLAAPAFRVACAAPAGGRVEVWLTPPVAGGQPLASVSVPCMGDMYAFASVAASVPVPASAGTVWLALHGPVRLDWFEL